MIPFARQARHVMTFRISSTANLQKENWLSLTVVGGRTIAGLPYLSAPARLGRSNAAKPRVGSPASSSCVSHVYRNLIKLSLELVILVNTHSRLNNSQKPFHFWCVSGEKRSRKHNSCFCWETILLTVAFPLSLDEHDGVFIQHLSHKVRSWSGSSRLWTSIV